MFYTGIGSRETPDDILKRMEKISNLLYLKGYVLRSGGADGADLAFERGAYQMKHIYLPWKRFNNNNSYLYDITDDAYKLAEGLHKGWNYLKPGAKKLMARNCYQVLGYNLKISSDFLICWTPDGCESNI